MQRVALNAAIQLEQDRGRLHHIAVLACLPDAAALRAPYIVVFAGPGGGYSKEYFDLQLPGLDGYSQAEHHVRAGLIVILFDHAGVGQSRSEGSAQISRETAAAVNDALIRELSQRLSAGTLAPGLRALPDAFRILMGQSMGGCLAILTQGLHGSCDALAVLGFSAVHTVVPLPPVDRTPDGVQFDFPSRPDYALLPEEEMRRAIAALTWGFYWDDVPRQIVQLDFGGGYPIRRRCPPWGSPTVPGYATGMTAPGVVAAEAARVAVPALLAFGERDVSPDPWSEPAAFRHSRDVSLLVVPRMAHMHNFAGTRQFLWDRVVGWARLLAAGRT